VSLVGEKNDYVEKAIKHDELPNFRRRFWITPRKNLDRLIRQSMIKISMEKDIESYGGSEIDSEREKLSWKTRMR